MQKSFTFTSKMFPLKRFICLDLWFWNYGTEHFMEKNIKIARYRNPLRRDVLKLCLGYHPLAPIMIYILPIDMSSPLIIM